MANNSRGLWKSLRRIKWLLDRPLNRFGYKLERIGHSDWSFLSLLLSDRLKGSKDIVFVQVGANDGISNDPIYPLIKKFPGRFRGLVVEPLKDKFELLQRSYADIGSVIPVNLAVHNTEKEMLIHRVRPEFEGKLPAWASGIGSFNAEHYRLSDLDSSYMTAEKVRCTTFDDLLKSHNIVDIELLITDTEGYDFEILRSIDFAQHRPTYVHFEHGLSSGVMSWERYTELVRYLTRHGYMLNQEVSDTTAFLPAALNVE